MSSRNLVAKRAALAPVALLLAMLPCAPARAGTPTAREQVAEFYGEVLGREAANGELRSWIEALAKGSSVQELFVSFLFSREHESTRPLPSDALALVQALAGEILGRSLEPDDAVAEAHAIRSGTETGEGLAKKLVRSPEFRTAHARLFDTLPSSGTAPASMDVFDATGSRLGTTSREYFDNMHFVATLQGNVNRDGIVLYVEHDGPDAGWLDRLSRNGGFLERTARHKLPSQGTADVVELALRYRSSLKGLVVWDGNVPATSNVASTLAGTEQLAAVRWDDDPGSLFVRLTKVHGFRVVRWLVNPDGSSLFTGRGTIPGTSEPSRGSAKADAYIWAKVHCLDTLACDPGVLAYYIDSEWAAGGAALFPSSTLANHDYFVMRRAFFFDLSPWGDEPATDDPRQWPGLDRQVLEEILSAASSLDGKRPIHVGGFVPWTHKYTQAQGGKHTAVEGEWEFVNVASRFLAYLDADAPGIGGMANASVFCQVPVHAFYPQRRPSRKDLQDRGLLSASGAVVPAHYVVLYAGDFDSAAWVYRELPGLWNDPARGKVPLAWAVNPNLEERMGPALAWIHDTATANDTFVCGDSGAGYVNPSVLGAGTSGTGDHEGALAAWSAQGASWTNRWDVSITGFVIDGNAAPLSAQDYQAFLGFSPDGLVEQYQAQSQGVESGVPFCRLTTDLPGGSDAAQGAASVNAITAQSPSLSFQVFRGVLESPSYYEQLVSSLDRGVRVIDALSFMELIRLASGQAAVDGGAFVADDIPTSLAHGEKRRVFVTVASTGTRRWEGRGLVRLGSTSGNGLAWRDLIGGPSNGPANERAFLPTPCCPGGTESFSIELEAPATGTQAVFEVRLVRDGEAWFGPTLKVVVDLH